MFYHSAGVSERMVEVRDPITYIRHHWSEYAAFVDGLRLLLQDVIADSLDEKDRQNLENVLTIPKEWIDRRQDPSDRDDFSVIRLYSSNFGYKRIFKVADNVFRANMAVMQPGDLLSAVFIVELLNIDLFNYVSVNKDVDNFQGVVYRGVCATPEGLREFQELAGKPVSQRYWAIPLAIISTSRNRETASAYAILEAAGKSDRFVLLSKIHVFGLDPELLQAYREQFSSSVVSTICAVPIGELSDFPDQEEVLLRGPFFQLIRVYEEPSGVDGIEKVYVVESVMLNTNRDHPSTMELGEDDGEKARQLFTCLVGMGRAKECKRLAEGYELAEDAEQYEQNYIEEREKMMTLME